MSNTVDHALSKLRGAPYFSLACATAVPAALGAATLSNTFGMVAMGVGFASPGACALLTLVGGLNLFRERSKLSKGFSAAAAVAGVAGLVGYVSEINQPGWEALGAFIYAAMGMTAGGVLGTIAHYTRNVNLKIQAAVSVVKKDESTPPAPPAP